MSDLTEKLAKMGAELNDEDIRAIRRECDTLRGRNVVHKDELRELIEQWRKMANEDNRDSRTSGTFDYCIRTLEDKLDG